MNSFLEHIYKQPNNKIPPFFEGYSCGNPLIITKNFNRFETIITKVQYTGTGNISVGYKSGSGLDIYRITILDSSDNEVATTGFRKNNSTVNGNSYIGNQTFTVFNNTQTGYQNTGNENISLQLSDFPNTVNTDRILTFNKTTTNVEIYTIKVDFLEASSNISNNNNFMFSLPCAGNYIVAAYRTVALQPSEDHCGNNTFKKTYFLSQQNAPDLTNLPVESTPGFTTYLYDESILGASDSALEEGIYYLDYSIGALTGDIEYGAITAPTPPLQNKGKIIDYTSNLQCIKGPGGIQESNSKKVTFYYNETTLQQNVFKGYTNATDACQSTVSIDVYVDKNATASQIVGETLYLDPGLSTKIKPLVANSHFALVLETQKIDIELKSNGEIGPTVFCQ